MPHAREGKLKRKGLTKLNTSHGIPRIKIHEIVGNTVEFREIISKKFRGIPRNSAEFKSLPCKIPSSSEFQKVTFVEPLPLNFK
jgi:hypothetical protein